MLFGGWYDTKIGGLNHFVLCIGIFPGDNGRAVLYYNRYRPYIYSGWRLNNL